MHRTSRTRALPKAVAQDPHHMSFTTATATELTAQCDSVQCRPRQPRVAVGCRTARLHDRQEAHTESSSFLGAARPGPGSPAGRHHGPR